MNRTAILNLMRAINDVLSLRKELASMAAGDRSMAAMVLLSVLERAGQSRVGQLACVLHVDMSVASRQVAHLEEQGLVERTPDPEDRRAQLVQVSQAGIDELDGWRSVIADHFQQALADWSEDETNALTEQLQRLRHSLDQFDASTSDPTATAGGVDHNPAHAPGEPNLGRAAVETFGPTSASTHAQSEPANSTGEVTRTS